MGPISVSLIEFPFLMPLLLKFLDDKDVLQNLLITGKEMRPSLVAYRLKRFLPPCEARHITGWHRYLPVQPSIISDWKGENVRYCTSMEQLNVSDEYDEPLIPGDLPLSLQMLALGDAFNQPLSRGMLPPQLKHLEFGKAYNQPVEVGVLPASLNHIVFGDSFNQPLIPDVIPYGVTRIDFGATWETSCFNKPLVPGALPESVTKLTLSAEFNQQLIHSCFPSSLKTLYFDEIFNKPLTPGILPNSITDLRLSNEFNQPLTADIVPANLERIDIGSSFVNSLWLPPTLTEAVLNCCITSVSFVNSFPSSLLRLELHADSDQHLPVNLLPSSLTNLEISQPVQIGSVPDGVCGLTYNCNLAIPVGAIPSTVKLITFGGMFNQPIPTGVIPTSVERLVFGDAFNQLLLPGNIPDSVKHIVFGKKFNQVLMPGALPESLVDLIMSRDDGLFNQPLVVFHVPLPPPSQPLILGSVPRSVTRVTLSCNYNKPLCADALPDSVTRLSFGKHFNQTLTDDVLPRSLKQLQLSREGPLIDTSHVKAAVYRS